MRRRKFLLGSSAIFASGGFFTSAGAFSSTETQRGVQIAVVGDENAYLGLREEEMDSGQMLFETGMPRTAPETFDITNQTAGPVDMTVELLGGDLAFTDATSGVGDVTVTSSELTITGLESGGQVSDVTIEVPGRSEKAVSDTLSFDVTGEGLQIDAKRDLELEPAEIDATIDFTGSISSAFRIPDIDSVDIDTLTVNGYETKRTGDDRFQIREPSKLDCEPGETITVTVRGATTSGVEFSGTASGLNCTNSTNP